MIRPPSQAKDYDLFYSGDPAFRQPPKVVGDATDEQRAELDRHFASLRSAKETGNWSALLLDGQVPTKFVCCQVDRNVWRSLTDRAILPVDSPRYVGQVALHALLFRLAVKEIVGWPAFRRESDPSWDGWVMAPASLVTQLDEIDPRIVGEVGADVFARLRGVNPLS